LKKYTEKPPEPEDYGAKEPVILLHAKNSTIFDMQTLFFMPIYWPPFSTIPYPGSGTDKQSVLFFSQ
jgi:hypothetical protein